MSTPSKRDRREAAAAIIEWRETRPRDEAAADALLEEIFARALAARSAVPDGHVRFSDGREVKAPSIKRAITGDGVVVIPLLDTCWHHEHGEGDVEVKGDEVIGQFGHPNPDGGYTFHEYDIRACYSTKEAAEAAARGGER